MSHKRFIVRGTQGCPVVSGEDGIRYVCLWRDHLHHGRYCDACGVPGKAYWERQLALLHETGLAVLTISDQTQQGWKRKDYHSLWRVEDVKLTENGLECRFVKRIAPVVRGSSGNSGGAAPLPQVA